MVKRADVSVEGVNVGQFQSNLGNELAAFKQRQQKVMTEKAKVEGQLSAAEGGELRDRGIIDTIFGETSENRAFNEGARLQYKSQIESDTRARVSELENQYTNDPEGFKRHAQVYADATIGGITDPQLKLDTLNATSSSIEQSFLRIQAGHFDTERKIQAGTVLREMENKKDDILRNVRLGNNEHAASNIITMIESMDAAVSAGLVDPVAAERQRLSLEKEITEQNVKFTFDSLMDKDLIGAMAFIDDIESFSTQIKNHDPDEQEVLANALKTDLTARLNQVDAAEKDAETAKKKVQEQNEYDLLLAVMNGEINTDTVLKAGRTRAIDQEGMLKIIGAVDKRGLGVDDPVLVSQIQEDIEDGVSPEVVRRSITDNVNVSISTKTANDLLKTLRTKSAEDSIFKSPEIKRERKFLANSLTVTGPLGSLLGDKEAKKSKALREFDERVEAGEDSRIVADDLLERFREFDETPESFPRPRYGTKENLEDAEKETYLAWKAGKISDDDLKREMENLKGLRRSIDVQNEMVRRRKEAR